MFAGRCSSATPRFTRHRGSVDDLDRISESGFRIYFPVNEPTQDHSVKSRLSPEAVMRLRTVLKQWVDDAHTDDSGLGDAIHTVAREARERGVHAEELLVTLKTTWFEVGGAPNAPHASPSSHKKLDELVTACIKAYYE